jgi:hypothetical protein
VAARGGSEGRVGAEAELSRAAGFGPLLRHARGAGAEGTFGGCGAQLPPGGLAGRGESEGGGGARRLSRAAAAAAGAPDAAIAVRC